MEYVVDDPEATDTLESVVPFDVCTVGADGIPTNWPAFEPPLHAETPTLSKRAKAKSKRRKDDSIPLQKTFPVSIGTYRFAF